MVASSTSIASPWLGGLAGGPPQATGSCPATHAARVVVERSLDVPYYEQTSEFTCGPACVLMTAAALTRDPFELARVNEFKVWRRCCLIGIGGTDAFGFALPLLDRGLDVRVLNETTPTIPRDLLESFLTEEDATLAQWSSKQAREEAEAEGADVEARAPTVDDVGEALAEGWVPNCLVGMDEVHGEEIPHWVVVLGVGEDEVLLHDPYPPRGQASMTVPRKSFVRMLDEPRQMGASSATVFARAPRGEGALSARADLDT